MYPPSPAEGPRCYLQIRFLPESCQPAYLVRHRGVTLLAVDPRSSRAEVLRWSVERLSHAERDAYRVAYSAPPFPADLGPRWASDLPFPMVVPKSLQLPARGPAWTKHWAS